MSNIFKNIFFSFPNPGTQESLLGILTHPDIIVTDDETEKETEKQLFSIGIIIFRIDIIWN